RFDPAYLALPREVLLASMAKYQRVFAMEANSQLLPQCVAILDGSPKRPAAVRHTVERILNARLADSLMFWTQDHARLPLERMAQELSGVMVHERLGSMADKTLRLRALSEVLAEAWRLTDEERQQLRSACQLAKADLVSTMVKEFPTLQGVVGKYYARDSGEPPAVAEAIEEQYLPLGEHSPRTLLGSALAILDKYDTLTGYFGLGIEPTGDQDPFGLRRAAQGIVEVAWTVHRPLPLDPLIRARGSMAPFLNAPPKEIAAVGARVQRYLFERLYTFAWPPPAPMPDCIAAVLHSPCADLIDAMDRMISLQRLNGQAGLLKAAKVIERTHNILKGSALRQTAVDPSRLQEPLERRLWE
ncbi:MAG TPA: glycine--tRNA ligase subunit beta, partial [archaeon]|nr:glycine--tRNA ligase subunit beta [archaeon]